jgi:hypothetical protein
MQTAELVELAAIVALHGPTLIAAESHRTLDGIDQYWVAAKCRFDRWAVSLGRLKRGEPLSARDSHVTIRSLIEEILGSEVLDRVWTAVVAAFDRRRNGQDHEIVARSVHIGHLEMRRRALQLLLTGPGVTADDAVELNRLRRRAEQWTDLLLASLTRVAVVHEFAFEPHRLRTYSPEAQAGSPYDAEGNAAAALALTSVRSVARQALSAAAPNVDLNACVGGAVLRAFPPQVFDSFGLFQSPWALRLAQTTDDIQLLVDAMFEPVAGNALPEAISKRLR